MVKVWQANGNLKIWRQESLNNQWVSGCVCPGIKRRHHVAVTPAIFCGVEGLVGPLQQSGAVLVFVMQDCDADAGSEADFLACGHLELGVVAVSYTHLTLPTKRIV